MLDIINNDSTQGYVPRREQNEPATGRLPRTEAGDLLVSYIEQIGVKYVFGVPGGAIEPLYNALARSARNGGPRVVVARHETGAAFMADGYSRETGRLGVCCATTGPGATNLLTGVASAFQNRTPVLAITAQTAMPNFGRGALQESSCTGVNTLGMFEHCTAYNSLVSDVAQLETKIIHAVMAAYHGRTTAHLSIPLDIMRTLVAAPRPSFDLMRMLRRPVLFDSGIFEELCGLIATAKNPVILLGGGAAEAAGAILEFAQRRQIPVITTPHGKGLVNPEHPQYRGIFGFAGHRSAYALLAGDDCDLVLAAGTTLGEWDSCGWDKKALLNERLVQIDESGEYFARGPMARLHVQGSVLAVFEHLLKRAWGPENEPSVHQTAARGRSLVLFPFSTRVALDEETHRNPSEDVIKPQRLMADLGRLFPYNTRFLADPGSGQAWAIHYLHPHDRRIFGKRTHPTRTFHSCLEYASMGWSIGAAVGIALGNRKNPVVCIVGDGSFLMSGQELTVAVQERLTVIYVILNDSALGMVKHGQRLAGAEAVGFDLPVVEYDTMARAMGARAYTIRSAADLAQLDIGALCRNPGPTLLDVHIDKDEVPPMRARMKVLGMQAANVRADHTPGNDT